MSSHAVLVHSNYHDFAVEVLACRRLQYSPSQANAWLPSLLDVTDSMSSHPPRWHQITARPLHPQIPPPNPTRASPGQAANASYTPNVQASPTRQESPVCSEYTTLHSLHLQATSYVCCRRCPPSLEARNRSQASARKGSASRVSSCCAPPTAGAG
jgi:hypothetical protein